MFKHYIFLLLFSMGLTVTISAQDVTGTVLDDRSQPLPGVSVIVKGNDSGTVTDYNGKYILQAEQGSVLVFSFIGFKTQEATVSGNTVNVTMESGVALDEVVLVGSRSANRTVIESVVPIDVIDVKEISNATPQVNLNQILNYVAPSFSSNTQTISDGTDHIDPASLRGLGPDQVLVLVNGKRRHTSSLVNINGTFGRGNVGTDLNAIPAAAIKRVEVLRDGAAAQYGSDAIAGVINIVLNNSVNELNVGVTTGANFSKNANGQEGGVDGETVNVSASYGLPLGDKGGFINFSGDFDYREAYSRMKEWEGSVFNGYNSVEWVAANSGADLSDLSFSDIQFYAQGVTHFGLGLKNDINNATSLSQLQGLLDFDTTDNELIARGQERSDYNMRVGQSELRGGRFFANFSLPLDDKGTELYSFAGISTRKGNSAGFYRLPNQARAYTPLYINGFLPEINSNIKDQSLSAGIKGKIGDWDVDFSNTWGRNSFLFVISNSSNASLQTASPTTFDAGGFAFTQNTTNLDIRKYYEDVLSGFNVAFGGEHRAEVYDIIAGEEESYTQYDVDGNPIISTSQTTPTDFFGRARLGSSQVFPGFSPDNELSRNRSSVAAYLDLEADITKKWLVSGAARFENYSDFGSTINFKLASRYKLTENFNIRAAGNTGFRAPSLHQLNFNSVSTLFGDDGEPIEVGTFTNDSDIAQQLGIPALKEETSQSVSLGFTTKIPAANLSITADAYFVAIEDRVVLTGQFDIPDEITTTAERAAFFANAIDTESKGLDVVITHKANLGSDWKLKSDLAATFSQTRKVGGIKGSEILAQSGQLDTYFDENSRVYLEESVPRTKVNLSNNLSAGRVNVFLRNVYFGEVTGANNNPLLQEDFSGKVVTDLSIGFKATDQFTFTVGANNLLDVFPDRASTGDLDPTVAGVQSNRSSGRFDWSRRAQQFGIGGRFLFARLSFVLK